MLKFIFLPVIKLKILVTSPISYFETKAPHFYNSFKGLEISYHKITCLYTF